MKVAVNGTHLWVTTRGEGPDLFVLHGGTGLDQSYFHPGMEPMDKRFRCHFIDLTGHGKSGRIPAAELTHERWVEDIEALRQALGLGPIYMLGHSYGGFIAQEFAVRHPASLAGLFLVGTAACMDHWPEIEANVRRRAKQHPEAAAAFLRQGFTTDEEMNAFMLAIGPLYFHGTPPYTPEQVLGRLRCDIVAAGRSSVLLADWDMRPRLQEIQTPTLVLDGDDDFLMPHWRTRELGAIPDSEVAFIEDAGHLPWVENPKAFFAVIDAWLADHTMIGLEA